jgi:fucose 4-O-acetylase-like acetyltransferase
MNLDFLKGLLIILVVVDHNEFSRALFPGFLLGMTFHVVGFMTIPFLKPAPPVWTRQFADYAFRLYYPFLLLTCAMWALVTVMGSAPLMERLGVLGIALYSGNADMLKVATQMGLLWFLPSFISVVLLRGILGRCGTAWRVAGIALLLALHLVIGAVAKSIQDYLPLGLLPALYMVPLAYAGAALHRHAFERMGAATATLLALALFAAVKTLQMQLGLDNEVGFASVADYRHPLALLVNDMEAVFGTLMLFQFSRWKLAGLVAACGKYSMQVYLFHAFVALGIYKALLLIAPEGAPLVLFLVSVLLTVLLTLGLAWLVMRVPLLTRLIFPRSPQALLGHTAPSAAI